MNRLLELRAALRITLLVIATSPAANFAVETQQTLGSDVKPILWPEAPRPRTVVTPITTMFDGYPVSILSLRTLGTPLELVKRDPFSLVAASSGRYSVEFASQSWPNVYLGLSYFEKDEFLPDLSEKRWHAYKAGLPDQQPDAQIVFESSNIEGPATPHVLGSQFRQIAYEIQNGPEVAKKREIFAFVGEQLIVVSITGLKSDVDRSWTRLDQFISEMSLAQ